MNLTLLLKCQKNTLLEFFTLIVLSLLLYGSERWTLIRRVTEYRMSYHKRNEGIRKEVGMININLRLLLLSLAPQPSLGFGLLHKIGLNNKHRYSNKIVCQNGWLHCLDMKLGEGILTLLYLLKTKGGRCQRHSTERWNSFNTCNRKCGYDNDVDELVFSYTLSRRFLQRCNGMEYR
jgi:hypothetical protein